MSVTTATELRSISADVLEEKLTEARQDLFRMKLQATMGRLENPMAIRQVRRRIARIKTVLTEKVKGIR